MRYTLLIVFFLFGCQLILAQDKPDGQYKDYYDSGELMLEGHYKDGKRTGEWKAYYKNGKISNVSTFTAGKKEIPEISFYENGNIKRTTEKQGDIHIVKEYYESGQLFYERVHKSGYYKEFREDGTLKVEANYRDFELYGKWILYDNNQNIVWNVSYENGYRNGIYQQYYDNGQLQVEGVILKDKKNGEEKRYDTSGNLSWKGRYKNDLYTKTWIKYDVEGKKIKKINTKKENLAIEATEVPDGVLEKIAIFPTCEQVFGNNERKKCANIFVNKHIASNFNLDLIPGLSLSSGKKRVFVRFKIDESGNIDQVQARGPHPVIEREAIRVIRLLPKVKPAKQRNRAVTMPFSVPIVFTIK